MFKNRILLVMLFFFFCIPVAHFCLKVCLVREKKTYFTESTLSKQDKPVNGWVTKSSLKASSHGSVYCGDSSYFFFLLWGVKILNTSFHAEAPHSKGYGACCSHPWINGGYSLPPSRWMNTGTEQRGQHAWRRVSTHIIANGGRC